MWTWNRRSLQQRFMSYPRKLLIMEKKFSITYFKDKIRDFKMGPEVFHSQPPDAQLHEPTFSELLYAEHRPPLSQALSSRRS